MVYLSSSIAAEQPDAAYDAAIAYARAEGTTAGKAAASWYFDGNTPERAYAAVLRGIEDGDPAVLDTFPTADLSGEWADRLTGPMLVADALSAADVYIDSADGETYSAEYDAWFSDICDAYEIAFSDAVTVEIERAARYQVETESETRLAYGDR